MRSAIYLGIVTSERDKNDNILSKKWDVCDYVCKNVNDEFIIGLCQNSGSVDKTVDPIFCWILPNNWSLEDGITIPHAYTMVKYYQGQFVKFKKPILILILILIICANCFVLFCFFNFTCAQNNMYEIMLGILFNF